MLKFRTQFPIQEDADIRATLSATYQWIAGSRHYALNGVIKESDLINSEEGSEEAGAETLNHYFFEESDSVRLVGVELIASKHGLTWTTHMVARQTERDAWVSLELTCEAEEAGAQTPSTKRPVLIDRLLDEVPFGRDGSIDTIAHAHNLMDSQVDLAKAIVLNCANNTMPVVYLSATTLGRHVTNPSVLAKRLAGMAHVVVEPNRAFSQRLRLATESQNPFGGQVGLFWPDSGLREILHRYDISSDEFIDEIAIHVQSQLLVKGLDRRLSWNYFQKSLSQHRIKQSAKIWEELGSEQSEHLSRKLAEQENQHRDSEETWERLVADIEQEKQTLQKELQKVQVCQRKIQSGQVVNIGTEEELYPGEFSAIMHDILTAAAGSTTVGNRRHDVLRSLRDANPLPLFVDEREQRIKQLMTGYRGMDSRLRKDLEDLGFEITEDGKHYKISLYGDDRYTVALAKTPSEGRGILNWVSDLKKKFF